VSESQREDDDVAWLLARAKGQPGPSISATSAARYEKLEALLADLPAGPAGAAPREGWQDRVLAAIDDEEAGRAASVPGGASKLARRRRTRWLMLIGVIAVVSTAAVGGAQWLRADAQGVLATAPVLDIHIEAAGSNLAAMAPAMVGDAMVVRGVIDGAGELRVYDDEGVELARCVAPAQECSVTRSGTRTTLQLTMVLRARGSFRALLFAPPLTGPSGGLDVDLRGAGAANLEVVRGGPVIVP
jgi:hypothetical protein